MLSFNQDSEEEKKSIKTKGVEEIIIKNQRIFWDEYKTTNLSGLIFWKNKYHLINYS